MDENLYEQIKPISCYQVSFYCWNTPKSPRITFMKPEHSKLVWFSIWKPVKIVKNFFGEFHHKSFQRWTSCLKISEQKIEIRLKNFSLFWSCLKCVMNLNFMRSFDIAQGHLSSMMTFARLKILLMTLTLISNTAVFGWEISNLEIFR